jgi:hypothetical protein
VASCSGNSTFGGPEANVLVDLLLDRMQNSTRCAFAVSNSTGYLLANSSCVPAMWHQLGMDLDGEAAEHSSGGGSVSLLADGKTVAIGARYNDANASDAGHVRVYDFNDTSWNQVGVDWMARMLVINLDTRLRFRRMADPWLLALVSMEMAAMLVTSVCIPSIEAIAVRCEVYVVV